MTHFLKEPIIAALESAGRPLKPKDLARRMEVSTEDYRPFRAFLRELVRAGELYQVKGGRFAPPDRINLVVGQLSSIKSGAGFVVPEKGGDDLYIPADETGNAMHGDKVVARIERQGRRGPEGQVVRVLERGRTELVGTLRRAEHFAMVSPDDPKLRKDILVPLTETREGRDGEKVVVGVTDWGSATSGPVGKVTDVIGMPGDPGVDILMIIKHNGLPTEFPTEVEEAAEALPDDVPAAEIRKRLDLRDVDVVTIDPVSAKDFDDALSLTELPDGNLELGVHIADVSHYVRYGDALDVEAHHRGTSVYLVDRVIPMLPEKISNHLCSLNPDVDRLAMSAMIVITPRGKVLDYRIEDTVIRSSRRLSYEQAQAYFDGDPEMRKELDPVVDLLDRLRALAKVLNQKKDRRGALDFDLPESRVELDKEGFPIDIYKLERLESHRLVETFMLLANEIVAQHLKAAKVHTLYRVHEDPAEDRLELLQEKLGPFGYSLQVDSKSRVPPRELGRVLAAADGKPEEFSINTLVLRTLALARYDEHPLGHYGLALKDYAHFTSPIRRYPDLIVHRTLRILSGKQPPPMRDQARYKEWIAETAIRSSERERLAERAERDSIELKKIQFMERHIGDEFDGVVTGVEVFGFFVELTRYHVSGLVHVNNLDDDYYEYWEEEFALAGSNTGRRFALGDRVRVQVLAVKKEVRQIDFLLLADPEPRPGEPPRRRRQKARTDFEGTGKSRRPRSRRDETLDSRKKRGGRGGAKGKKGKKTSSGGRGRRRR